MALDRHRLLKVKLQEDGSFIAQCPACAAEGGDSGGVHLIVYGDGAYACVAHPGDREHARAVFALAGEKTSGKGLAAPAAVAFCKRFTREEKLRREFRAKLLASLRSEWAPAEIRAESPGRIPEDPAEQARAVLRLFPEGDVLWIGDHKDSGNPRHRHHFRTAAEWIRGRLCPAGPRICPSSFRPGVFRRTQGNVLKRRFLVIESDSLGYGEQGALFAWLRSQLRLRAVIDTRGRSLHGWFESPGPGLLREIRLALGSVAGLVDPALFNPAQPCRLPGWPRADSGLVPDLIFLDP